MVRCSCCCTLGFSCREMIVVVVGIPASQPQAWQGRELRESRNIPSRTPVPSNGSTQHQTANHQNGVRNRKRRSARHRRTSPLQLPPPFHPLRPAPPSPRLRWRNKRRPPRTNPRRERNRPTIPGRKRPPPPRYADWMVPLPQIKELRRDAGRNQRGSPHGGQTSLLGRRFCRFGRGRGPC